jgi:hypothetical protein
MTQGRIGARKAALAAALALLSAGGTGLSGCADADRVAYLALAGEAPGDKPLYTGFTASVRFGRPPPAIGEKVYRPPQLPDGPTGPAADQARLVRQAMSDRASDYELRARYLRLNAVEFATAAQPLKPAVGQPLPPDDQASQARFVALRQAMTRIQADVLSLNGIVLRTDQTKAQAERALAAVRANPGAADLVKPLTEGITNLDRLLKDGDALVAVYVEWMGDQRTALDALEDEIRRGTAAGPAILQRQSIFQ